MTPTLTRPGLLLLAILATIVLIAIWWFAGRNRDWHEARGRDGSVVFRLATLSTDSFRFEISNLGPDPVLIDTYPFGHEVKLTYFGGHTGTFDFGADKVRVPTDEDWAVLEPGASIDWTVSLPPLLKGLEWVHVLKYSEVGPTRSPPRSLSGVAVPRIVRVAAIFAK